MGRAPCCEKVGLKRGRWTAEEDNILINYVKQNGDGSWRSLPKNAGLLRCGKSCRLRWINYLREDLKRGNFTREEEETIIKLHRSAGNKWSLIASSLPGRTDNEVKNYWNSHLSRKIYSFRSCNGSMAATAIDMVKMTNASKRKGGRVSRAVAKKYSMPTFPKSNASPSRTGKPRTVSSATSGIQEATTEESGRNDLDALMEVVESESINCNINESTPGGLQTSPEFMESPEKMEKEIGAVGPNGMEGLGGISSNEEETGKKSVEPGMAGFSSVRCNNSDNGDACSHSDSGDMYECFSPINSYFNPELLTWDAIEYPVQGFQLWDQEYDTMLWPWE